MSPLKGDPYTNLPEKIAVPTKVVAEPVAPVKAVEPLKAEETKPIVILSELDSYITERMKEQPRTLEEVESRVEAVSRATETHHRLSLPPYFQTKSYDAQEKPGPYIFRWQFKEKRAIDRALNVLGWTLVNRVFFPEAPRYLFSANGGVEVGDAILAFMPAKKALEIREKPARLSQERLESRMTQVDENYVLMTGNPKDDKVYQPSLPSEAVEETEMTEVKVEGKDF